MEDFRFEGLHASDGSSLGGNNSTTTNTGDILKETAAAKIWKYTTCPVGAGIITMLIIFGILLGIQPPFIQTTPSLKDRESTGIRWIPLAIWSVLSGILVILIQPMSDVCKSIAEQKTNEGSLTHI